VSTSKRNVVTPTIFGVVTLALIVLPLLQSGGDIGGTLRFLNEFGIFVLIYGIITLGLNIQLGYAGISNFGVAGFFLVGAYVASLFVVPPATSSYVTYVGGFVNTLNLFPSAHSEQWLPFVVGALAAALACALMAALLSLVTPRLRADYLAIATIGVAELLREVTTVQTGLVNGDNGLLGIPAPLDGIVPNDLYPIFYLVLVGVILGLLYFAAERGVRSPYGRGLRAIREDETTAAAAGKNIFRFKLQSFMFGAAITGIGGALYAWFSRGLTPSTFEPFQGTFLFWMMLIVGGVGSNLGAIGGAYIVWGIWVVSLEIASFSLPDVIDSRIPYIRLTFLGVFFIVMLVLRPQGLISEQQRVSRWLGRLGRLGSDHVAGAGEATPQFLLAANGTDDAAVNQAEGLSVDQRRAGEREP
jgi:branched-chain amino acid transport system permease protein